MIKDKNNKQTNKQQQQLNLHANSLFFYHPPPRGEKIL